ncbi:MAG: hypothetical protein ACXIVQ_12295 [Acidimicrobiales bacterium]
MHHTGVAGHASQAAEVVARSIERDHLARGWNGAFYGLLAARDGRLLELRGPGWRSIGDHSPTYRDGTPVDPSALCVVLPGDYRYTHPTVGQADSLKRLRLCVADRGLRTHGQREATACPGVHAQYMADLLNLDPHSIPPPPGGTAVLSPSQDLNQNRMHHDICGPTPDDPATRFRAWLPAQVRQIVRAEIAAGRVSERSIADYVIAQLPEAPDRGDIVAMLEGWTADIIDAVTAIAPVDGPPAESPGQTLRLFIDVFTQALAQLEEPAP